MVEPEGGAGVARMDLGGEGDPGAGLEAAVGDGEEPAHDGVRAGRGSLEDGPDHGVHPGGGESVRTGAQGGQRAGQHDPPGAGGVDAEPGLAGQGAAGPVPQGGVGGVPAGRDRGCTGTDEGGGDDRGRRCGGTHGSSVEAGARAGHLSGMLRIPPGGSGKGSRSGAAGCPEE